jgi:RNA-binding protein YlmH
MMGLPGELREYLTIWAIGTILGVTKDVDLKFTHEYERARVQVLILDPSLIPQSVDVVIYEFIYELHFRVECEDMAQHVPVDMEDDTI